MGHFTKSSMLLLAFTAMSARAEFYDARAPGWRQSWVVNFESANAAGTYLADQMYRQCGGYRYRTLYPNWVANECWSTDYVHQYINPGNYPLRPIRSESPWAYPNVHCMVNYVCY